MLRAWPAFEIICAARAFRVERPAERDATPLGRRQLPPLALSDVPHDVKAARGLLCGSGWPKTQERRRSLTQGLPMSLLVRDVPASVSCLSSLLVCFDSYVDT